MIRRALCFLLAHDWRLDARGEPVVQLFMVCRRCGRWRRLPEDEQR